MLERLLGTDPTTVSGGEALVVLTRAAARVAVPVAIVLVAGALAVRGTAGAVTALGTSLLIVGLHVGSGLATARLSRRNPLVMPALTMVALLLRLGVYGVVVLVLGDAAGVDVPVLAVTVVVLTIAMLAVETRLVAAYSRFWWLPAATDDDVNAPLVGAATSAPSGAASGAADGETERTDA